MSQIILRGELGDTLAGLTDRSDLLNENGELLGVFMPMKTKQLPMFEDITEDEIQRRRQQKGGKTLTEICQSLGVNP
jgi:hypothetical protein